MAASSGSSGEIAYRIRCVGDGCPAVDEQVYAYDGPHQEVPLPAVPDGWTRLGTSHFCPRHLVSVRVRTRGGTQEREFDVTGTSYL